MRFTLGRLAAPAQWPPAPPLSITTYLTPLELPLAVVQTPSPQLALDRDGDEDDDDEEADNSAKKLDDTADEGEGGMTGRSDRKAGGSAVAAPPPPPPPPVVTILPIAVSVPPRLFLVYSSGDGFEILDDGAVVQAQARAAVNPKLVVVTTSSLEGEEESYCSLGRMFNACDKIRCKARKYDSCRWGEWLLWRWSMQALSLLLHAVLSVVWLGMSGETSRGTLQGALFRCCVTECGFDKPAYTCSSGHDLVAGVEAQNR